MPNVELLAMHNELPINSNKKWFIVRKSFKLIMLIDVAVWTQHDHPPTDVIPLLVPTKNYVFPVTLPIVLSRDVGDENFRQLFCVTFHLHHHHHVCNPWRRYQETQNIKTIERLSRSKN